MTRAGRARPDITRVIVFDLDDTLYLERDYIASGFRAVDAWVERNLYAHGFAEAAERRFAQGRRGNIFDLALRDLGLAPTSDRIARLVNVYRQHMPHIRLAADAEVFLENQTDEEATALLSDGFLSAQRNKIRALELETRDIWPLICTDVWGRQYWKPHVRGFMLLQRVFGLARESFTYVADNPSKDFVAPRQLGWNTVEIRRSGRIHGNPVEAPSPADRTIGTLDEL